MLFDLAGREANLSCLVFPCFLEWETVGRGDLRLQISIDGLASCFFVCLDLPAVRRNHKQPPHL